MGIQLDPVICCVLSVAISVLFIEFLVYKNPARIPLRKIVPRAAWGYVLLLVVWTPVCLLVYGPVHKFLAAYFPSSLAARLNRHPSVAAICVGLLLPQLSRILDLVVLDSINPVMVVFRKVIIKTNEATVKYLPKIIRREAQKFRNCFTDPKSLLCIDRLFEFHATHIALDSARRPGDSEVASSLLTPGYRKKYKIIRLLGFLGYANAERELKAAARKSPDWILVSWVQDDRRKQRDRRKSNKGVVLSHHSEQRSFPYGRRRSDSRYVHHYRDFVS